MQQLDLLAPRARKKDPVTSHKAAERAKKFQRGHCKRILEALEAFHPYGMSSLDLAMRTGLEYHAVARRMSTLREAGLITGTNHEGGQRTIWHLK